MRHVGRDHSWGVGIVAEHDRGLLRAIGRDPPDLHPSHALLVVAGAADQKGAAVRRPRWPAKAHVLPQPVRDEDRCGVVRRNRADRTYADAALIGHHREERGRLPRLRTWSCGIGPTIAAPSSRPLPAARAVLAARTVPRDAPRSGARSYKTDEARLRKRSTSGLTSCPDTRSRDTSRSARRVTACQVDRAPAHAAARQHELLGRWHLLLPAPPRSFLSARRGRPLS